MNELTALDRIHENNDVNNVHDCGTLRRRYAVRRGWRARWRGENVWHPSRFATRIGHVDMNIKHIVFVVLAFLFVALAWYLVAPAVGGQVYVVKPEDRICTRDADCQLVEVPCTCGQSKLAVNAKSYKRYEHHRTCSSAEISHCAAAGASVPQAAVCRVDGCAAVKAVPRSPELPLSR